MEMKRTHHCGELRATDAGTTVVLSGWVNSCRHLGGLVFVDLRDREGITQLVLDPATSDDLAATAKALRDEWVITVRGMARERPAAMVNRDLATGAIEVGVELVTVENTSRPMPFHLDDASVSEDLRLKYRYLDMRRSALLHNLRLRHRLTKAVRDFLDSQGFIEVETPILSKSTPEGARDYLIPSRVHPGKFFALPQAPQQYKQLLMVGGVERYFQIARCFRDEDLRADRQPEFTQIDVEMSFVDRDDIITVVEGMLTKVFAEVKGMHLETPFPRLTYAEAMARYGSDKPDVRFAMELFELTDVVAQSGFRVFDAAAASGGVIKGITVKGGAAATRKRLDAYTALAAQFGAKGLAWLKVTDEGGVSGPVAKFLSAPVVASVLERAQAGAGDLVLIVADRRRVADEALGRLRLDVARESGLIDADRFAFLWVVDFPLLDFDDEEQRYVAVHHPFTSPLDADVPLLESAPGEVRAKAYDVVLNGVELGGGSIRIHRADLQQRMFTALGITADEAAGRFGHLLDALAFGAPPHGGIALGLDRFAMLLAGATSIREMIAFPKTTKAACLMTDSPSPVDARQMTDLHIRSTAAEIPSD